MAGPVLTDSVMIRIQQWQGECTGLDSAKIHCDKSKTGASYGGEQLGAKRINNCPYQVRGRQLDPGHFVVVADPQVVESQLSQGGFSTVDLTQLGRRNRMVVRNPRCQTRSSRLVGNRQTQSLGNRTHRKLGHAGLG